MATDTQTAVYALAVAHLVQLRIGQYSSQLVSEQLRVLNNLSCCRRYCCRRYFWRVTVSSTTAFPVTDYYCSATIIAAAALTAVNKQAARQLTGNELLVSAVTAPDSSQRAIRQW
jgi:hypothetical protein